MPLGHEFSGAVIEAGADVTGFEVGDPVTVTQAIVCTDCRYCTEGTHNLCESVANPGPATKSGGFAEAAVVPERNAIRLPDDPVRDAPDPEPRPRETGVWRSHS